MQHKNFFMVPNRIFDLELKPRDFTVYCCLLRHSDSTGGYNTKSGLIRLDEKTGKPFLNEQGKVEYLWEGLADISRDIFSKRCTGKIREIRPLKEGGIVPENPEFTIWIGNGIPPKWWEENGVFYAKVIEQTVMQQASSMLYY